MEDKAHLLVLETVATETRSYGDNLHVKDIEIQRWARTQDLKRQSLSEKNIPMNITSN